MTHVCSDCPLGQHAPPPLAPSNHYENNSTDNWCNGPKRYLVRSDIVQMDFGDDIQHSIAHVASSLPRAARPPKAWSRLMLRLLEYAGLADKSMYKCAMQRSQYGPSTRGVRPARRALAGGTTSCCRATRSTRKCLERHHERHLSSDISATTRS